MIPGTKWALLSLYRAHESPGDLVKRQIQIQKVWGRAQDCAFPSRSQVVPRLGFKTHSE